MQSVGIVGVGLMGHGIAKNIVSKGWNLNYLKHPGNQPTVDLEDLGAVAWDVAADMAIACDILLICVTGSPQVEDVLVGSGQVLTALRKGAIVIDCSTAVPSSTRALAAKVAEQDCHFIDAAMTRTPKEAEEGRLNLLIGGDREVIERVKPLFGAFAENLFIAGDVGSGHQLKLVHNVISLGSVTLIAEVAACALADGMDREAMIDCLRKGGAGGTALERIAPFILEDDLQKLQFSIENAYKDIGYYSEMAKQNNAACSVAEGIRETLGRAINAGAGKAFMPELVKLLQNSAP
ncbi:NAD(P)-dependent oxidoreductase [Rhizobium leguminosarum]|uniref:NAD(P)-dependent oxidoreductase n=1 Tax=Rhizobium leguminosarum TaxID=384 RepID=UPI0024A915A6|nr:NAD(P)-dependent oxidoreductase [Rhizobium leguminosarum]MDI5929232.1 NAD(P)-dependent oxidoreductase [Rhizobium leguminosarum]